MGRTAKKKLQQAQLHPNWGQAEGPYVTSGNKSVNGTTCPSHREMLVVERAPVSNMFLEVNTLWNTFAGVEMGPL